MRTTPRCLRGRYGAKAAQLHKLSRRGQSPFFPFILSFFLFGAVELQHGCRTFMKQCVERGGKMQQRSPTCPLCSGNDQLSSYTFLIGINERAQYVTRRWRAVSRHRNAASHSSLRRGSSSWLLVLYNRGGKKKCF